MTKSNKQLQALVQEIHKLADLFTGFSDSGSGNASTSKPNYTPGSQTESVGRSVVVDMQRALIGLAKDVASQSNSLQQETQNKDPFGAFLSNNYMGSAMNALSHIGGPLNKNEFISDGKWGPKTDAAIHNAFAFATGLFNFVDDVNRFAPQGQKITLHSYHKENLPGTDVDFDHTQENAQVIASHVRAIQNMYQELKNDISERPALRQFTDNDATFKSYQKSAPLNTAQMEALKNRYGNGFVVSLTPDGSVKSKITVDYLVDLKHLQDWAKRAAPSLQVNPSSIIDQVMQQTRQPSNGGWF